jgi:flagellar hook-length control protein FliK
MLTVKVASAHAGAKSMTRRQTENQASADVDPRVAKTEFSNVLDAKRIHIAAIHNEIVTREAKAKRAGNRSQDQAAPQSANDKMPDQEPAAAPMEDHAEDSEATSTPVAKQEATPDDQKEDAKDAPSEAVAPVIHPPANPAQPPVETTVETASQVAIQVAAQAPAQVATQTPGQVATQTAAQAATQAPAQVAAQTPAQVATQVPAKATAQTPARAPAQVPAQAPAQVAVQTSPTINNGEQPEESTPSSTTPTAKPSDIAAPANAKADPKPAEEIAQVDEPIDEKASVSTSSQEASELPPTPAASGRKQAHENRDHAAHIKAMETDASPEQVAGPQASPPPIEVGAGTELETALADETATTASTKEPSAKPVESAGVPLVMGETTHNSKEAQSAELAPAAQESPRTQSADTMDQIVLGLKGKMDARTGKAEIQLDPPNLGTMKVSVTLENGLLTAEFQSPSPVVRNLLQGNLEKLKTVLEGQGVAVDRLAVNAPADAGGSGQNPQASFGSATHDGRSAGQYHQDPRSNNGRSGEGFARVFNQAQEAPLDLVA